MIDQSRIDGIKTGVDLVAYIGQATGAAFKKNGKGYVCQCPFPDHEDKTPSFTVTPRENLWHCFGCGRGGDIFEFDHLYFNLDFKASVQKHEAAAPVLQQAVKKEKGIGTGGLTVKDQKLLTRVVSYYQHAFAEDPKGRDYLKGRGISANQSTTDFGAGFANGTLLNILPEDEDILSSFKRIGILNARIKEAYLKNPGMLEEMLEDLAVMGVIGELVNKTVCYLAATSRKLAKPVSVLIQSRSSADKSTLQNAILSLMPEEEYENYTRVTDQSLFYKEEDSLVHKILAIEEDVGMGGAAYSIRNIQSSGRITVATTGKDPGTGKMKTEI